ncbi:trigger factor [Gemmiger sp. An120]|uniref:trigger factor n=1 Tax=Gemmiger TaxID=204475 RepID=UPI000B3AB8AD|nr:MULTISPECIES: trigger factor [Gemmiger]MBM6914351.1 trigger factor [Gemmiger formicilis]OUQ44498.1 trigger factor [Gemmiger sp. An120]HIX33978.1 trigger factor [Candidatus Gemmiger avium]
MKLVKNEKLEKSMVELQFSVDAETFRAAVDKAYKREGKKYNVPGFRKGKAPRAMIEKMYGADIFHYDAINDLFPENYEAAVKEAGLEVVGQPEVDVVSMSMDEGVVLKAVVPVKPEVTVGEYTGLKVTRKVTAVEDADVEAEITRMQERNGRMITREGKAENGDTADIDFEGFVDGVAFEGGKGEHYSLVLGSNSFIPGFEEQVVGHEAGEEFDVNVTFPEQYHAAELAGKPAVFKIKLHEVKYKELPALDDEFAKDVSEYDTLDELRASIRKEMEERNAKQADVQVENDLVDQVIATLEGEIPEAMYESRMDDMVRDFEYRLSQQGLKLEMYLQYMGQTLETFRASYKEQAEKQVKIRLALEAIAAKEKLEASDEDFNAEVKRIADQYKMEEDKVRELVDEKAVKADLAVNKAIDFIKEKAEITTEEVKKDAPAAE